MTDLRWARVRTDATCQLRRGAWYRILRLTTEEAVLDVNSRPVGVSRSLLYMLPAHPGVWSVVPRPQNSKALPVRWGPRYAVCPECRNRAALGNASVSLRCAKCGGVFEIGWGDAYFA
ncbi:MAG TPA: hypothetical protein VLV45_13855 [Gemmatimonadales bacterium]|jgi:hypothetical protein|nr:hypothetical protein [Gemmatimonadales bacterium]